MNSKSQRFAIGMIIVVLALTVVALAAASPASSTASANSFIHTQQSSVWHALEVFAERALSFEAFMPDYRVIIEEVALEETSLTIAWSVALR